MNRTWRRYLAPVCFAILALHAEAGAAEPSAADKTAARALFDEGRNLASSGKYTEACVKFEESQKLVPGVGTMFNLADCYEHVGRTATAWSMYLEVASQMRAEGQKDREKSARERAAAIEPKLSRLTIVVAPEAAQIAGLVVRRDGTEVSRGIWGSAIPLDPGAHVVEAAAPGRKNWSNRVDLGKEAAKVTVTVPALDAEASTSAPVAAPAPTPTPPPPTSEPVVAPTPTPGAIPPPAATPAPAAPDKPPSSGSGRKTLGLVIAGVGVVGFGVGTGLAFAAKSKFNDSAPYCNGNKCSQTGVDLRDQAVSRANVATIVGGVGLAAVVAGVVVFLTAPSSPSVSNKASAGFTPVIAVGPGSISMAGRF